ncbi:MAG: extracellular solute-binding protein [Clostridia bacterium]|nr:extracellular solute-binding protein [Clostridia bacterium]
MNRTKIQRLTALLLCLIFVVSSFSVNVFAADSTGGSADTSQSGGESVDNSALTFDTEEMLELLDAISYREYIKEHASVKKADGAIVIDAIKDVNAEKSDIDVATSVDTFEGVKALLTPGTGQVSWTVTVPETAKYTVKLVCYAIDDGKVNSVERIFKINGKVPFAEARYLNIKKNWVNEYATAEYHGKESINVLKNRANEIGLKYINDEASTPHFIYPDVWTSEIVEFCDKYNIRFMKLDINNNEIRPTAYQSPEWIEYVLDDSTGYYTEAFEFVLFEGENTITLEGKNAPMAIKEIILAPVERIDTYEEYLAKHANKPIGQGSVKLEGEYFDAASDKTIYPVEEAASAATSPHDPSRTLLNVVGGEKWQTAGQTISYKFRVDASGMYDIVTRFRQNVLDGMFVNRALYIYSEGIAEGDDGYYNGVPFEEAKKLTYNYNDEWQVTQATDGNQSFKFYFAEGVTYTMVLEVTLGDMGEVINTIQECLNSINSDYLSIIQLTGATPDTYRNYGFSRIMPDVLIDMVKQAYILNYESEDESKWGIAQKLTALAGQKSSSVGTLQKISDLLLTMGRDEDEVARQLTRLKSYIGTLGTFLSSAKTQPLEIDYILVQPAGSEAPSANANFFQSTAHEISRFYYSFSRDYDNMGALTETDDASIEVWIATGRDQSQVKRNLLNNEFTPNTGIAVELKLVAGGTLLPSILAKQGPDVYHGLDQGSVINYAIRSAILPIEGYEDFEEVTTSFNDAAMLVLGMEDANGDVHYYGLPEAQGFAMMYVRLDILADLGIGVPRTWDDLMATIPVLQSKKMEIGLSTDINIHLYQMGGTLFADNGMRINLDSQIGLAAFTKMCNMFTKYSFPYSYDAANRFRTGEMPIVIADYTGLYNQLKVFATEIEGLWAMVPVPGIMQEDGTVNNCTLSSVSATVQVAGGDGNLDDAWEYMKWFTGDECQEGYANEMVALLGPSAKYATANIKALESMPWTTEEYARIKAQFDNLASVPNYPGSYIIGRYTEFAFLAAYNEGEDPAQALLGHISTINKEITRKRLEFGLETLETGQTLASKRLDQAKAAAEELLNRNSSNEALVNRILSAVKSEDPIMLNTVAEEVMGKTSADNLIKIAKGPDIATLSDGELIYYISIALSDAAAALLTY